MFTKIVVLYMAFIYNLPTWCKVFMSISLAYDFVQFAKGFFKGLMQENE